MRLPELKPGTAVQWQFKDAAKRAQQPAPWLPCLYSDLPKGWREHLEVQPLIPLADSDARVEAARQEEREVTDKVLDQLGRGRPIWAWELLLEARNRIRSRTSQPEPRRRVVLAEGTTEDLLKRRQPLSSLESVPMYPGKRYRVEVVEEAPE